MKILKFIVIGLGVMLMGCGDAQKIEELPLEEETVDNVKMNLGNNFQKDEKNFYYEDKIIKLDNIAFEDIDFESMETLSSFGFGTWFKDKNNVYLEKYRSNSLIKLPSRWSLLKGTPAIFSVQTKISVKLTHGNKKKEEFIINSA